MDPHGAFAKATLLFCYHNKLWGLRNRLCLGLSQEGAHWPFSPGPRTLPHQPSATLGPSGTLTPATSVIHSCNLCHSHIPPVACYLLKLSSLKALTFLLQHISL